MAEITGSGGGTVDLCSVSPTDQLSQISNILNRLQQLEAAMAAILGTNVEAIQLSDFSNSLGWIYNVTYLGEEGWTQTPSGTLIPPDGWTGLSGIIDGQSGITIYGTGGNKRLNRVGTYASDIATTSSAFMTINTTLPASHDPTNGGIAYLDPSGTDGSGDPGWEVLVDGVYSAIATLEIDAGTSVPTYGTVYTRLYRRLGSSGSSFTFARQSVSTSDTLGWQGLRACLGGIRQYQAGDFIKVYVSNRTDGDITVGNIDLTVTFEGSL